MANALNILLVEDNDDDALLFKSGVRKPVNVTRVSNASNAIRQLSGTEPLPDLIVLDVHLKGMSSHQFLDWLQAHPTLNKIPICAYTADPIIDGDVKKRVRAAFLKTADPAGIRATIEQMFAYLGNYAGP